MVKKAEAKRTVSFFRLVVEQNDGNVVQFPAQDWQAFLARVKKLPLKDRTYESPTRQLIGHVLMVDQDYALKLMEPRDQNSWLEILRRAEEDETALDTSFGDDAAAAEAVDEAEEDGGTDPIDPSIIGTLVETSLVAFLPAKNVVGMILGSTSSPSHAALAEWIDMLKINGKRLIPEGQGSLRAEPALSKSQQQRLGSADGVSKASIRVSTSKADQLAEAGAEDIATTLRNLGQTYGNLFVTITLAIPRGKANEKARRELKEEAERFRSVSSHAEAVSATLVTYDAEARAHSEEVNFVSQRITMTKTVPLTGTDGEPIRNTSAVRAILAAAYEVRAELDAL